jgi:PAS domain-containing protein
MRNVAAFLGPLDLEGRRRLWFHAIALASVAGAAAVQTATIAETRSAPFWPFHAVVALTAAYGGFSAALVATLASVLAGRLISQVTLSTGALFSIECIVLAGVVVWLAGALQSQRQRTAAADRRILELKSAERRGELVDTALSRLDERSVEAVIVVLDAEGCIADWRNGAAQLFARSRDEVLGLSASTLFGPDVDDGQFAQLLSEAREGGARRTGPHRGADDSLFMADVEIVPLSRGGLDGFTMLVRDLRREQADARLRTEADAAHRQLAALQQVTDPLLNALASAEQVTTLLDRLREAIAADGVALIRTGGFGRRVFCASGGLQCQRAGQESQAELRGDRPGRALIIHNDPVGVSQVSAVRWPDTVSSLIAVPVVCAGSPQAVIEVASTRSRRSTEWEIALVQVVAARIAGILREDPSYAGAAGAA